MSCILGAFSLTTWTCSQLALRASLIQFCLEFTASTTVGSLCSLQFLASSFTYGSVSYLSLVLLPGVVALRFFEVRGSKLLTVWVTPWLQCLFLTPTVKEMLTTSHRFRNVNSSDLTGPYLSGHILQVKVWWITGFYPHWQLPYCHGDVCSKQTD